MRETDDKAFEELQTAKLVIGVLRLLKYMRTGLGRENWRGGFSR